MFSGLVEARAPVRALERRGSGARLVLCAPSLRPAVEGAVGAFDAALGDSIAVSGCCLTLAARGAEGSLAFDLSAETLERTWFAGLEPGRLVNLERALRLGDRLGGHLVSGHVDGLGRVVASLDVADGGRLVSFEGYAGFERWLVDKGSVCVDGISLTVVRPRGRTFDVAVIPETLERTSLGAAQPGQRVHLEADLIGKWVERILDARGVVRTR